MTPSARRLLQVACILWVQKFIQRKQKNIFYILHWYMMWKLLLILCIKTILLSVSFRLIYNNIGIFGTLSLHCKPDFWTMERLCYEFIYKYTIYYRLTLSILALATSILIDIRSTRITIEKRNKWSILYVINPLIYFIMLFFIVYWIINDYQNAKSIVSHTWFGNVTVNDKWFLIFISIFLFFLSFVISIYFIYKVKQLEKELTHLSKLNSEIA